MSIFSKLFCKKNNKPTPEIKEINLEPLHTESRPTLLMKDDGLSNVYPITESLLENAYPSSTQSNRDRFVPPLNKTIMLYGIDENKYRVACFLAQIGHESGQLKYTEENLNYSSSSLQTTFKKYFPDKKTADEYARKPEKIANKVYANRMGNGNEQSGDGYKYRGRGLIQLTGKDNYDLATKNVLHLSEQINFVNNPELVSNAQYAAESAGWFWKRNGLNELADKLENDTDGSVFKKIVKIINGGYNGLDDRKKLYNNIVSLF
jgi:putative chitinase